MLEIENSECIPRIHQSIKPFAEIDNHVLEQMALWDFAMY